MYDVNQTRPAEADRTAELREFGKLIRAVLGGKPAVESAPPGYLTTLYRTGRKENTLALHIFNSNGLIQPAGTELSHKDIIDNFVKDAVRNPEEMNIVLNMSNIKSCRLYTPEQEQIIDIKVNKNDNICRNIFSENAEKYCKINVVVMSWNPKSIFEQTDMDSRSRNLRTHSHLFLFLFFF